MNRRRFLRWVFATLPVLAVADAAWWEPRSLRVRKHRLTDGKPTTRFVHFTDLHFKGDRAQFQKVMRKINALSPEFVCFTGDIVEDAQYLPAALELFADIKSPVFGVPGNHDYWSRVDFAVVARAFAATGGAWLLDETLTAANGKVQIMGASCERRTIPAFQTSTTARNLLLLHYPAYAKQVAGKFDLLLAGHSHGGQVRIPFFGAPMLPFGVDEYDLGMFTTPAGRLYVGAGIGWFYLPLRFLCPPEITVFEM
jgi:uncharacterized protein